MKNLTYGFVALLLMIFAISACNKLNDPSVKAGQLIASKSAVKINEPDSLLLVGAASTDSIRWSVTPAGFDTLITLKNKGLIKFTKSGSYQVKTINNGKATATTSITVSDSVYHAAGQQYTVPLTGDKITLVPHYYHKAAGDSSYVYFIAETSKSYCANGTIYLSWGLNNGTYNINLMGVSEKSPCTVNSAPINTTIALTQNNTAILPNGTFPLSATLNGSTYTGNMVVAASTITFNWNYTSGVLISPKQINK